MPRDTNLADQTTENRNRLCRVLRGEMPKGFKWRYADILEPAYNAEHKPECGYVGCAMGIATIMFPEKLREYESFLNHEQVSDLIGISRPDAERIFLNAHETTGHIHGTITPSIVADLIELAVRGEL